MEAPNGHFTFFPPFCQGIDFSPVRRQKTNLISSTWCFFCLIFRKLCLFYWDVTWVLNPKNEITRLLFFISHLEVSKWVSPIKHLYSNMRTLPANMLFYFKMWFIIPDFHFNRNADCIPHRYTKHNIWAFIWMRSHQKMAVTVMWLMSFTSYLQVELNNFGQTFVHPGSLLAKGCIILSFLSYAC